MEAPQSPRKASGRPRSRKSIAHIPSGDAVRDQENLTVDIAGLASSTAKTASVGRKIRSKSIGPGGLDALQNDAGNRQKSPVAPQYKSILKPSVPFSPPKAIPPRSASRKGSPGRPRKSATPEKSSEGLLIDFSIPQNTSSGSGARGPPNPFEDLTSIDVGSTRAQSPSRVHELVALRTEEEQQESTKERERQEIAARKDARRKSLANRRVSFAPEATLHTWDVVEMPEDSTTSSASTNLTRRASSLSAATTSPYPQPRSSVPSSDASEPPSTPPQEVGEVQVSASPAHQRDLHQKKRRRSSGIPPMNFNNPDDFSSSPNSVGSGNGDDSDHTAEVDADSSDSDDKDLVEDETVTGVDGEDYTARSNGSSNTGSSGRLEEALRQAARQAGTQGIDYDENGDITMEMADDEVTTAFKPWLKQDGKGAQVLGNPSALQNQENINPFSPAFKARFGNGIAEDRDETMELTKAVGTILPSSGEAFVPSKNSPQKIQTLERRRSNGARRRSSGASSSFSEETMDLTVAVGGIQNQKSGPSPQQIRNQRVDEDNGEATMDFTAVVGGALHDNSGRDRRESEASLSDDEDMDFTVAGGGILQSITERTEPSEDDTMGMDITAAIGAILPEQLRTHSNVEAKNLMERETDNGQLSGSTMYKEAKKTPEAARPADARNLEHVRTVASETGSPSLIITEGRGSNRRDFKRSTSLTPKTQSRQSTPLVKPATPSKQLTPRILKPETPGKTPPPKNISMRTGSPRKLFKAEIKQAAPSPRVIATDSLFRPNLAAGGNLTPNVVLKPRSRRASGVGVDRSGIGSPRVTELLARRSSIGESAEKYVLHAPAQLGVRFADPQTIEQEIDQDRANDQRRESGLQALQQEADDQDLEVHRDATTSLKDKIESLTPQKKRGKLNGRKSLHVGAAKGLLGKRPAELDSDEDGEDSTPKRLKGRENSPIKKIKLPAPPPKSATTGRMTRSGRASLVETEGNSRMNTPDGDGTPIKGGRITTPMGQPRFKDAGGEASPAKAALFSEPKNEMHRATTAEPLQEEDRIRLQDFLNLTSIRFMELTTTKRRHTLAPNGQLDLNGSSQEGEVPMEASSEVESCVVAGACTLPMLDLYQHSCRELKKYITEGRTIVREIEEETFEENPPLFREYLNAPADVKSIMDNQFKNVKTHARLLSKAMWYEWRMKLLDGLKEGLLKNGESMDEDAKALSLQEQLINPVLPGMLEEQDQLEDEARNLQAQADDLANCDQEELKDARSDLIALEEDLAGKRKVIVNLQAELGLTEERINDTAERRQETIAEIQEAERMRQNCQGWEPSEVKALQAGVEALEQEYGWTITSAADAALTMTYQQTLQLYFSPHSFLASDGQADTATDQANSPISLAYIADAHEYHPQPLTTEKRFFLQLMRAQLQFLEQSTTRIEELLAFVSCSWKKACHVAEEARVLGVQYITEPTILSDETLAIQSVVLLRELKTKVNVSFEVGVRTGAGATGIDVSVKPNAAVVYGEELNGKKMGDFLEQKAGGKRKGKDGEAARWARAVKELEYRLVARGKKS